MFAKTDQDQNPILQVYKQKFASLFRNVLIPITLLIIIIANIDRYIKCECELSDCTWNWESDLFLNGLMHCFCLVGINPKDYGKNLLPKK